MKKLLVFHVASVVASVLHTQTINYNNTTFISETNPPYASATQATISKPGYSLIWNDEFEYTTINQLWTDWNNWPGGHSSGVYFNTTSNTASFVSNDQNTTSLRMFVNHLSTPIVSQNISYYYEGANIVSKKHFIYGYYEARIKLSNGRGAWPAFWLYGNNGFSNGEGNPTYYGSYNEIDIMECGPDRSFSKYMTYSAHAWHYGLNGAEMNDSYHQTLGRNERYYAGNNDLAEEYHIYALDFSPTLVSYYLDGILVGTISDPVFIDKLKKQAMWLTLDNGINQDFFDYTTPNSNYFDIDYVRVYKKNSTINLLGHTCSSGNYTTLSASSPDWYSSLPNGKTISYQWSLAGTGVSIIGASNSYLVTINNPNNVPYTATCSTTITYPDWAVSTATATITQNEVVTNTFKYPDNIFTNVFNIGTPQCTSGNISVTVTGVTNPAGGLWQLWNTDANGNFTNSIQSGYGTSITFTNLQLGTTYAVTRGTWDACTPWCFVQKNFTVSLSDFSVSPVTCSGTGNKHQVTCTANNNISGATWQLWPCDQYGTVPPNSQSISGSGVTYTYNNLNPDSYYKIVRSEQSTCSGTGSSSSKVLYVPDLTLDPYFETTIYPDVNSVNFTIVGNNVISSPNSWWGIYNSNVSGAPLSQYGNMQSGSSATFGPSNGYYLYDGNYYLLVHAAYSDCSLWNWRGYLILNNTRHGGPTNVLQEIELDSLQVRQLQNDLLADSSKVQTSGFRCYPNPANGILFIELPSTQSHYQVELFNSLGQLIMTDETVDHIYRLNLEFINKGSYILKISDQSSCYTETVIVD